MMFFIKLILCYVLIGLVLFIVGIKGSDGITGFVNTIIGEENVEYFKKIGYYVTICIIIALITLLAAIIAWPAMFIYYLLRF